MANEPVIGQECKAYYNTGTHASPTWVLIADAQDVRIATNEWGEAELLSRASSFAKYKPTIRRIAIEIDYVFAMGTTVWQSLLNAFHAKTVREFAIMDGAIATTSQQGLRAFCNIFSMPVDQPQEDWVTVTLGLKPAYQVESSAVVDPDWYTV